jgi:hypothetical protein
MSCNSATTEFVTLRQLFRAVKYANNTSTRDIMICKHEALSSYNARTRQVSLLNCHTYLHSDAAINAPVMPLCLTSTDCCTCGCRDDFHVHDSAFITAATQTERQQYVLCKISLQVATLRDFRLMRLCI